MCLVSNLCTRNVLQMDCLKWKTQRLTVNLSLELAFGETMPMSNRNSSMKLHTAGGSRHIWTSCSTKLRMLRFRPGDQHGQQNTDSFAQNQHFLQVLVLSGFQGPSCLGSERRSKVVCELPCCLGVPASSCVGVAPALKWYFRWYPYPLNPAKMGKIWDPSCETYWVQLGSFFFLQGI